jgi:hypothetical protein
MVELSTASAMVKPRLSIGWIFLFGFFFCLAIAGGRLFESTMGPKRSALTRPIVGRAGKFSDRGAYLSVTMD